MEPFLETVITYIRGISNSQHCRGNKTSTSRGNKTGNSSGNNTGNTAPEGRQSKTKIKGNPSASKIRNSRATHLLAGTPGQRPQGWLKPPEDERLKNPSLISTIIEGPRLDCTKKGGNAGSCGDSSNVLVFGVEPARQLGNGQRKVISTKEGTWSNAMPRKPWVKQNNGLEPRAKKGNKSSAKNVARPISKKNG